MSELSVSAFEYLDFPSGFDASSRALDDFLLDMDVSAKSGILTEVGAESMT